MYFKEKLKLLMTLFKINNSQLARGINVDASLVSRWKSGQRKISVHSPHVASLATYFIRLNAHQYQKDYLDQLIQARLPQPHAEDERTRILVLSAWLISDEPPNPINPDRQPHHLQQTKQLIVQIARLLADPDKNLRANLPADVQQKIELKLQAQRETKVESFRPSERSVGTSLADHSDWMPVRKFRKASGRRQAVLSFLQSLLAQEKPQTLYLYSEDRTDWMTEDREFAAVWAVLMQKVIRAGHRITIIHCIHRDRIEIEKMLAYWMPLHLSGHLRSYYQTKTSLGPIRHTQFIIAGKQALLSSTVDGDPDYLTLAHHDPEVVAGCERLFQKQLSSCRPLLRLYQKSDAAQLFSDALAVRQLPGAVYSLRESLSPLSLPQHLFNSLVPTLRGGLPEVDWVHFHQQHQASFLEHVQEADYVDVYPLDLLDQIERSGQASLLGSELFLSRPILLSRQDTLAWLDHLISQLKRHPRYRIVFSPAVPGLEDVSVSISYKESQMALFSSRHMPRHLVIRLDEHHVLQGLSVFIERLLQDASQEGYSDKGSVLERLEKLRDSLATSDSALALTRNRQR